MSTEETGVAPINSNVLMDVSDSMVRLHKEQFGRGPTSVRCHWAGRDTLVCLLENTLTPGERNLVQLGEDQRLRDTRMMLQYATLREFCTPVERIIGRKVRSFISGIDVRTDGLAVEIFVLHPAGYDGPSRMDLAAAGRHSR